ALLPELFPTNVRYTGSGISYNVSSILGAAVAPFVAVWLWQTGNGSPVLVGVYLAVMAGITLLAPIIGKETRAPDTHREEPDEGEESSPSPLLPGVSQTLDTQLAEGGGHILGRGGRPHLGIYPEYPPVLADIDGVPPGIAQRVQYTVGPGDRLVLVTEQGEVRAGLRGKAGVLAQRIDTGHEVADIVLADQMAVLRQRLALDGAAGGIGSGKPGQHHRLPITVVRQAVGLTVGARQLEVRGQLSHFKGI